MGLIDFGSVRALLAAVALMLARGTVAVRSYPRLIMRS